MNIKEFYKWLNTQSIEDKLVYLRYKYQWENKWTYSKEYLMVDITDSINYSWLNDWHEGQQDVEVLGCINIEDVFIPSMQFK